MADTAKNEKIVEDLAKLMDNHKGEDTIALYIGEQCGFADYFLISTIASSGHSRGMVRHIKTFLSEMDIHPLNRQKNIQEEGWILIDCGWFVIHLMDRETRNFYDLENLWHQGKKVYQSSKSS